jgi:hypothetical protein
VEFQTCYVITVNIHARWGQVLHENT